MVRVLKEICQLLTLYWRNIQFDACQVSYEAASFVLVIDKLTSWFYMNLLLEQCYRCTTVNLHIP